MERDRAVWQGEQSGAICSSRGGEVLHSAYTVRYGDTIRRHFSSTVPEDVVDTRISTERYLA